MGQKVLLVIMFIVLLSVLIWSGTNPFSELTWFLEVLPIFIGVIILAVTYRNFPLTTLSYTILFVLFLYMAIGGHYSYAKVPLFDVIKDKFDLKRNNYDRIGHLLKGAIVIVLREVLLRTSPLKPGKWLFFITTMMVLGIAAIYEVVEVMASFAFEHGSERFLELQGDKWDSYWDMGLAFIGAIIAYFIFAKLHNRLLQNS